MNTLEEPAIIQRSAETWQALSWQDELRQIITDPAVLLSQLDIDQALLPAAKQAAAKFPLRVTPSFVGRMKKGDIDDPLFKQVMPIAAEARHVEGFIDDPLAESQANPIKGLIHKYHGRVLLMATTACAINCRYCFRREFDYQGNKLNRSDWQRILDYLKADTSIAEVILSGGDPMLQSDAQFEWLLNEVESIEHIGRIRVHSRLPIVLPSRITPKLIELFSSSRLQSVWVVHCNHANEIDSHVGAKLRAVSRADITLLNQSVLLRGINDTAKQLIELSEALFTHGVLPYYLHTLDKVTGTAHFDVDDDEARSIYAQMSAKLPGYLLPKLAREDAGAPSKTQLL